MFFSEKCRSHNRSEAYRSPQAPKEPEFLYFQFQGLSAYDELIHAVCTRHGGVSAPPFDSLNTSNGVGDNPENVRLNLAKIREFFGARRLYTMQQVHGKNVRVLKQGEVNDLDRSFPCDAVITNIRGLALTVRQADCQAVILFDPDGKVIANVHCGWRGNRDNILQVTVERMKRDFGSMPERLRAAIGPSLGPCCAEFVSYKEIFPDDFRSSMVKPNYFNLWEISRRQLKGIGLRDRHIESADICTRCRTDLFYSYRAEEKTGRFATLVMLR